MADGHDENDELGLLKLADDAIVAQATARQAKCIWTRRSERIKDAALKGGATKARLTKGARVLRLADARGREIPHCASRSFRPAKPSGTQKARRSESERKSRPAPFGPVKPSGMQTAQMTWLVCGAMDG